MKKIIAHIALTPLYLVLLVAAVIASPLLLAMWALTVIDPWIDNV